MSASLVGSEMCIRDRSSGHWAVDIVHMGGGELMVEFVMPWCLAGTCLLYTSDAADECSV
eukprot:13727967-Alexandrium_andersonii.AAC.1